MNMTQIMYLEATIDKRYLPNPCKILKLYLAKCLIEKLYINLKSIL